MRYMRRNRKQSRARYRRILLFILDGCGVGSQEDVARFHTSSANTLGNVYARVSSLRLPFLESLGLGSILSLKGRPNKIVGGFGKMREITSGNDTFAGVLEMFGIIFRKRFVSGMKQLPLSLRNSIESKTGIKTICNTYLSGLIALDRYYIEHRQERAPILYLSDDGVILLAAHTDVMRPTKLNNVAERISRVLFNRGFVRIITRPFSGAPGHFVRNERQRKDFFLIDIPRDHLINQLGQQGLRIRMTAHLARMFDFPKTVSVLRQPYQRNSELFKLIDDDLGAQFNLQAYVIPDTDNLGHRKDVEGFGHALVKTDSWLRSFARRLNNHDLLIITADHGTDPTTTLRGHTREYVPLLVYVPGAPKAVDLGIRESFADIGQTISENFNIHGEGDRRKGTSFLSEIMP